MGWHEHNRGAALWAVCAAGFAFSANYTNHAPVVPALMAEFHFNQAMAGLLTTGIFLTHALMQIPGGHLADRKGAVRVLAAALALVAVGNFGLALATAYWQLLAWKVVVGLGTGTCFVAGARYIATVFSAAGHLAQGLYGGSILLGSGFVIFAVPRFLAAFGWRGAFLATASLATIVLLLWLAIAPRLEVLAETSGRFAGLVADRRLWLLGVVQMASFGLVIVVGAWVAIVLRRSLGMTAAGAGALGSLVLLLGIVTRPLGGALLRKWGAPALLRVSLVMSAAGCFIFASGVFSRVLAGMAILLLGTGCGLPYAALFNRAAALYPGRAGAAMGLVNMLGISMVLAGAPLVGLIADVTGRFQTSFLALGLFTLAALGATAGIERE